MPLQKIINDICSKGKIIFYWCETCVSACRALLFRTNVRLWEKVAHAGQPGWDERNKIIAKFIPAGSSVLDIGCGPQTLKQYLQPGCIYQPCDIIKSSADVIFCDLNREGCYPKVSDYFEYVVCSGVFEYVKNSKEFLNKIPSYGANVLMSYNPLSPLSHRKSKLERLGGYWINHFTRKELENIFDEVGLNWALLYTSEFDEVIYSLHGQSGKGKQTKAGGD